MTFSMSNGAEAKERLKVKLGDRYFSYDGYPSHRARDVLDFLARRGTNDNVIVAFRENVPDDGRSDDEVLAQYREALQRRAEREQLKGHRESSTGGATPSTPMGASPGKKAPPHSPVAHTTPSEPQETVEKLRFVIGDRAFATDALPSQRTRYLLELIVKQNLSDGLAVAAYRQNMPNKASDLSDANVLELIEATRLARQKRRTTKSGSLSEASSTAAVVPSSTVEPKPSASQGASPIELKPSAAPTASPATDVLPPAVSPRTIPPLNLTTVRSPQNTSTSSARQVNMGSLSPSALVEMSKTQDIESFIQAVVDGPTIDLAERLRSFPTESDGAANVPVEPFTSRGDKFAILCQGPNNEHAKVVHLRRGGSHAELESLVERKFGQPMMMHFMSGQDKVLIDDDDVMELFLGTRGKLRIYCTPQEATSTSNSARPAPPSARGGASFNGNGEAVRITEVRSFVGHSSAVYCVAFSPHGDKFCTASRDHTLRLWDTQTGLSQPMKSSHSGFVLSCDYSPKGDTIVSSSEDTTIKLWNVATLQKSLTLKGHEDKVYCVRYNPTGTHLVSASCDRTVKVWNAETGAKVTTLRGHDLSVFYCVFSNQNLGQWIATASDDRLVKLWNWRESVEVRSFMGHTGTVWSCSFSSDDSMLVSSSMDHEIKVWKVDSGTCLRTIPGHHTPIHHVLFGMSDKYIFSCARDWSIAVWAVEDGRKLATLVGHNNTVYHMDIHKNMLLSCSLDESIKLWALQ